MSKKFFGIILSAIIFVSACFMTIEAENAYETSMDKELISLEEEVPYEVRQAMKNQIAALESYNNLMSTFPKDEIGLPIYPDEYAGAYIKDGDLIIQLIDASEEMKTKYIQLCGTDEKLHFDEVEYSLNELSSYETYAMEMIEEGYNVVGFGVCETQNSFEIYLDSNEGDATTISTLSMINSDLPINVSIQESPSACVTLWGGDSLKNEDSGNIMTAGICGTYNGEKALLTCGHGNEEVIDGFSARYPYIQYAATRIGQVSYQRANENDLETGVDSLGDFAIVTLNSDVNTTNHVFGAISITGTYSSLPEGTTIYKYGRTTGLSYGTITQAAISTAIKYFGEEKAYFVRGLYKSSMYNDEGTDAIAEGDSGGPVYLKGDSGYLLHGIVTARTTGSPNSIMYSTPIYYAIDAGFTVKTD